MDILQAKDRGVIGRDSSAVVHSSAKLHTFEGRKSNKAREKAMTGVFLICGLIAIAFVIAISGFLIISGLPAIGQIGFSEFMFGTKWASTAATPSYGILPFILTSIYGTAGAILIAVPIGLLCAVYLAKFAGEHVAVVIRSSVELLAGIPSVVYGLVGMIVIVPFVREAFSLPDGANLFSAILVLSVMVLPTVISQSETALLAVPTEYEEASLSLGATWTETVFKVSVPAAKSGIASAVVLGVGRAIGEAMAVMMVSGNVANMPGLFRSVRFLTTAVASEMSYSSGLQKQALFSIALILFIFIMIITLLLNFVFKKKGKDS
jgi:phosphate transport system permease protein